MVPAMRSVLWEHSKGHGRWHMMEYAQLLASKTSLTALVGAYNYVHQYLFPRKSVNIMYISVFYHFLQFHTEIMGAMVGTCIQPSSM